MWPNVYRKGIGEYGKIIPYEAIVSMDLILTVATGFEKEKVKCQEITEHSGSLYHLC